MRKRNAVLLAGALAAGLAAQPAQAKTYGFDLDGKTYYVTVEEDDGTTVVETEDVLEATPEKVLLGKYIQLETEPSALAEDEEPAVFSYWTESEDGNVVIRYDSAELLDEDVGTECACSIITVADEAEDEADRVRAEEYEAAGITHDENGHWIFDGRLVDLLLDENGGIYTTNAGKGKKNLCCIVVKRDEDDGIEDVAELSLEDAIKTYLGTE